jgi:hypothetical protein
MANVTFELEEIEEAEALAYPGSPAGDSSNRCCCAG